MLLHLGQGIILSGFGGFSSVFESSTGFSFLVVFLDEVSFSVVGVLGSSSLIPEDVGWFNHSSILGCEQVSSVWVVACSFSNVP